MFHIYKVHIYFASSYLFRYNRIITAFVTIQKPTKSCGIKIIQTLI